VPDWNQRVVCRANVPREERSRGLLSVGESEFEENGSEGKPYTSASYAEGLVVCGNLNVAPRRAGDCQLVLGRDLTA